MKAAVAFVLSVAVVATICAVYVTRDAAVTERNTAKTCTSKVAHTPDWWCDVNCNHDRPFCPEDVCDCDAEPALPGDGDDTTSCKAISPLVNDVWCENNCNHAGSSNCPTDMCDCGGDGGDGNGGDPACTNDTDCDDFQFCNGIEVCLGGVCVSSPAPFCASQGLCDEVNDVCLPGPGQGIP
eukprot:GFYU01002994.1.p1 GENE.GFYU01002994.1~~GFYU01002994.1.p1  ORF type:complete len:182 (+),score=42.60 GFYU01002994.1:100-645(+)